MFGDALRCLTTYPHPSDALQLRLRQISNNHRQVSGPTEKHLIMRGVLRFDALRVHLIRKLNKNKTNRRNEAAAADLRDGVYSVNPLLRGSQLRVPAHHHANHMALGLHHHLSNSQEHVRRTGTAHRFGGCKKWWKTARLWSMPEGQN